MNFLQLVQTAKTNCGVSGAALTTLTGQTKEILRLASFVNEAWLELQGAKKEWKFKWAQAEKPVAAGTSIYSPTAAPWSMSDFSSFSKSNTRLYQTAQGYADEQELTYLAWEDFYPTYLYGANRTRSARPTVWSIRPDNTLAFDALPDAAYTVVFDYYRAPQSLVDDEDIPQGLPAEYHLAIVYKAMEYYALYEAAPEVLERARSSYSRVFNQIVATQLPTIDFGATLV